MCAAPLALAGTLQADLVARGAVELEPRVPGQEMAEKGNSKDMYSKSDYKGSNENNILIEQSTTVNEVVIIWVNNGGGAATSTVTDTVTVTSGGAAATHSVSKTFQIWPGDNANTMKGYRRWLSWTRLLAEHYRSSSWRHGRFHIHVTEPHRHAICLHHSLRKAYWRYGFRLHGQS